MAAHKGERYSVDGDTQQMVEKFDYAKTDPQAKAFWRANRAKVEKWLSSNGFKVGPTLFLNTMEFTAERARMARELGIIP